MYGARYKRLDVVHVKVNSLFKNSFRIIEVYVVPTICSPISNQTIILAVKKYPTLNGFCLAHRDDSSIMIGKEIDILVGANHYWSFTSGNNMRLDKDIVTLDIILGWILSASFSPNKNDTSVNVSSAHVLLSDGRTDARILRKEVELIDFRQFWEIEATGIESKPSEINVKYFLKKIVWKTERYSVPLPWKPGKSWLLPDNYLNILNVYTLLYIT